MERTRGGIRVSGMIELEEPERDVYRERDRVASAASAAAAFPSTTWYSLFTVKKDVSTAQQERQDGIHLASTVSTVPTTVPVLSRIT
jgi:hypothetical protein